MTGPNILVVGAAKAGTTSLYRYLLGHPQVFMPRRMKEINYFSGANDAVRTEEEYLSLFEGADRNQVCVEISTSYLYEPNSAARISRLLGQEAKIVIIVRNPVDAAYSLWKQLRHFGDEPLSFEEALAAEEQRINDPEVYGRLRGWPGNYYYTDRYRYTPQVERFLNHFPKENIALYVFEEFFGDIQGYWKQLCNFCGIESAYEPANLGSVHNQSGPGIKSEVLHRALYENLWWKKLFVWAIPKDWKPHLRLSLDDLNKTRESPGSEPLAEKTRDKLKKTFADDVRALEKILGKSLADIWF